MMISKTTFVAIVSMLMKHIDDKKELLECSGDLPDKCVECIMEETEFQQDLITMLTVVTFDRFGVIRDYLYERDENGEYFFGIVLRLCGSHFAVFDHSVIAVKHLTHHPSIVWNQFRISKVSCEDCGFSIQSF